MQIVIDNGDRYSHEINDPSLRIDRTARVNDVGDIYAIDTIWTISGRLEGGTQAEMSTAITNLENGYSGTIQRVALKLDNGDESSHVLVRRNTLNGIQVIKPPHYPIGTGAEYATFRHYTVIIRAAVVVGNIDGLGGVPGSQIFEYQENITYIGDGGPRRVPMVPIRGLPIIVQTASNTPVSITQSGTVVAQIRFIDPRFISTPLFPSLLLPDQTVISHNSVRGANGSTATSWRYVMVSPTSVSTIGPNSRP